jgi:hypothetical protein
MSTIHTIEKMKIDSYKNARRRHEISADFTVIVEEDEEEKLSFSLFVVEYNQHMSESDENAQQRSYYSSAQPDRRY